MNMLLTDVVPVDVCDHYLLENANLLCDSAITYANKEVYMLELAYDYDVIEKGYCYESAFGSLVTGIERFFKNVINSLRRFKDQVKDQVNAKLRSATMKKQVRYFKQRLAADAALGKRSVEMIDVWTLDKHLQLNTKKIKKLAKEISKSTYKTINKLDDDLKKFDQLIDAAETIFEQDLKTTKRVSITQASAWAEAQLTQSDWMIKEIDECIQTIEEMEADIRVIKDKRDTMGTDYKKVRKDIGIVRRIVLKLSQFSHRIVGKRVSKIIALVVMFFA